MKFVITNRANPPELTAKFREFLPPYQWATYYPTTDYDGYEGAFDFLWNAIMTHRGKIIICDVDCFVFDWFDVFSRAWFSPDLIVSERSIPHRSHVAEHIGNPFFWLIDADRARLALGDLTEARERARNAYPYAEGIEPFWGLYEELYGRLRLPYNALPVDTDPDGITTLLPFAVHTWYAREYTTHKTHFHRINNHYQWAQTLKSTL